MEEKTKTTKAKAKRTSAASAKKTKSVATEVPERLRIKVQAYEYKILDNSVRQIIDTAIRYDAKVRGPVPLPTDTKKYTVNRSSFIFKNAREQYEMRTHRRLIDILEPSGKVIEALTNLSLPSGISIDVKMI